MQAMYEEASQVANDAIGSIRTVASFCSEKKVMDAYEKKCEGPMKQGVRLGVVSGVGFGFSFFVMFCTNALIFYIGAILVKNGQAKFDQVFMVRFQLLLFPYICLWFFYFLIYDYFLFSLFSNSVLLLFRCSLL